MPPSSPFAKTLRALATERQGTEHPSFERLLAYHEHSLGSEERDNLQEHLALCPSCARMVLDIASFPDIESANEGDPVTDFSPSEDLNAIYGRLGVAAGRRRRPWGHDFALPLAAILALTVVGLGVIITRQGSQLREQSRQIIRLEGELTQVPGGGHSFEILSLQPLGEAVRNEVTRIVSAFATDEGPVPVILNYYAREDAKYRVELRAAQGDVLRSWSSLQPTSKKNLTFFLSPTPRPGIYEFWLYNLDSEKPTLTAKFQFEITDRNTAD